MEVEFQEGTVLDISQYLVPAQNPAGLEVTIQENTIEYSLSKESLIKYLSWENINDSNEGLSQMLIINWCFIKRLEGISSKPST